jgi:UDP-glucose 4-epimerase
MKILVTGGAGCIGSGLVDRLLRGNEVVVLDNLSSGKTEHIKQYMKNKSFSFIRSDLLNINNLKKAMKNVDIVFHLAANPDIKFISGDRTDKDLRQNTIATYNVLEAMRINDIEKIVFSSTSAIYGEPEKIPTPESYGPLEPISLYGASKLACEGLVSSFCYMFGFSGWIFRFANIVGKKSRKKGATVISDFISKLRRNPRELEILGNGKQSKSYLSEEECIDGMLFGLHKAKDKVNILNLGSGDSVTVDKIAEIVVSELGLRDVKFRYTGGIRGWEGDVPRMLLDVSKINKLGWRAKHSSEEAVRISVRSLIRG